MINLSGINLSGAGGGGAQAATFPDVTIYGQPTINGAQISNFSAQNYLQLPFVVDFAGRPWQIDFAFTTGADVQTQQNILDSRFGLAFAVAQGKLEIALSSNGTSWNLGAHFGTLAITPETSYKVRMTFDGTQYEVKVSTNGSDYVSDIVVASTESLAPKQMLIGVSPDGSHAFGGSVNLAHATLIISGKPVWQGMTEVGNATRLAIDLSNIDAEGVQKINDIVAEQLLAERVDIQLSANSGVIAWKGKEVVIANNTTGVSTAVALDENGMGRAYMKFGDTYTVTFPTIEDYKGSDPQTYTAGVYSRNISVRYKKIYNDLRDVARSFVVEVSPNPEIELTGSEEVIDRILSHGAYVIDESTKKYARLSESDSNTFEDGTPWSGAFGNAFRYLPQIYVLRDKDYADGGTKYWISDEPIGDVEPLPESWIGMYKGSYMDDVLRSIPNVMTQETQTMSQFWNAAQRLGADYGLVNYFDHQKLNALHLAKFGNMNSDVTVGEGLCNAGSDYYNHRTGTTAALGNGTGTAPYLNTSFRMVRLFGIEDLFGTTWEFRPNIRFDGGNAIVYDGNIVSNSAQGKRVFGRLQTASQQYIKNMALGDDFDLVAVNANGASASTYWCDGTWAANIGQLLLVGGASNSGSFAGLAASRSNHVFSHSGAYIGARLAFKGRISDYELVSGETLAALHS